MFRPVTIKYYKFDPFKAEIRVSLKRGECRIDAVALKHHLNAEHFLNVEETMNDDFLLLFRCFCSATLHFSKFYM